MQDVKPAEHLRQVEKNSTWTDYLEIVQNNEKVVTIEQAYNYIIQKSAAGRDMVDQIFKIK